MRGKREEKSIWKEPMLFLEFDLLQLLLLLTFPDTKIRRKNPPLTKVAPKTIKIPF